MGRSLGGTGGGWGVGGDMESVCVDKGVERFIGDVKVRGGARLI